MKKITLPLLSIAVLTAAQAQVPDTFTTEVGAARITLLSDGQGRGNRSILIGATDEMMAKYAPDGTFPNAINAFLVRLDGKNILIDTGTGRKIVENLASEGLIPDQIDAILITHMHGDHIGGLVKDGKAVFPKAQLYIPQAEYDYWIDEMDNAAVKAVVEAYRERLTIFNPVPFYHKMLRWVIPGFEALAAPGHTPGHTMYMLYSGEKRILFWGDITHAMAIQIPHPEVSVTYDTDPGQAAEARKQVLEYLAHIKIPVAGMHIPYPGMGFISKNPEGGYTFTPLTGNAAKP